MSIFVIMQIIWTSQEDGRTKAFTASRLFKNLVKNFQGTASNGCNVKADATVLWKILNKDGFWMYVCV